MDYYWNMALSEALYPALATLEIALRNTIHDTFTDQQNGNDFWFKVILEPSQLREYAGTHAHLIRNGVTSPPAGKIVAELSFGFWTSILSKLYHQVWADNKFSLIYTAFPHLPHMANPRHAVYDRCNDIRLLRNRVMHYEPIAKGMTFQGRKNQRLTFSVDQLHDQILEAIDWINPTVRRAVQCVDRFDAISTAGRADIELKIRNEFRIP
ncbi:MAG: hypothetical protein KF883_01695 [Thermomicrobiales bacterium]|nr:hypothetical protein [Thermomicrobiales bacterium]